MDAMTLSYADMALAKDVLYGLYHDSAVRGLPNIPCQNEDGTPNTARNFTIGILKGGATHADIARRILAGLPGSPMPATEFEGPDLVDSDDE